ncbi:hypothetical protein PM082_020677 [Marasmius tenuissimus]|nr:hypothetical protein PM082_020677 [Marasmius tenuissimus]
MHIPSGILGVFLWTLTFFRFSGVAHAQDASSCTNPSVRREWRQISDADKQSYHQANLCLMRRPKQRYPNENSVISRWDDLVWTHYTLGNRGQIHFVANFMVWHRMFIDEHEKMLRNECGYTGPYPYWDWTLDADANAVSTSPLWDPIVGFGGNGVIRNGAPQGFRRCVVDGPYANVTFPIGLPGSFEDGSIPHCLVRQFNDGQQNPISEETIAGSMRSVEYGSAAVASVMARMEYFGFQDSFENGPHNAVHGAVGGEMSAHNSPNDAIFFVHHANADRIWTQWQGSNATRLKNYTGFNDEGQTQRASIDDRMPTLNLLNSEAIVRDYMNTRAGKLCYVYG